MNVFYRETPGLPKSTRPEPLSLRPREAALALGISVKTLERLTKAGQIAVVRISDRSIGYEVDELKAYLQSRRVVAKEVEV